MAQTPEALWRHEYLGWSMLVDEVIAHSAIERMWVDAAATQTRMPCVVIDFSEGEEIVAECKMHPMHGGRLYVIAENADWCFDFQEYLTACAAEPALGFV
jgi:hypothetical protein